MVSKTPSQALVFAAYVDGKKVTEGPDDFALMKQLQSEFPGQLIQIRCVSDRGMSAIFMDTPEFG